MTRIDDKLAALAIVETVARHLVNPSATDGSHISELMHGADSPLNINIIDAAKAWDRRRKASF
jgi:hypothetical protein